MLARRQPIRARHQANRGGGTIGGVGRLNLLWCRLREVPEFGAAEL